MTEKVIGIWGKLVVALLVCPVLMMTALAGDAWYGGGSYDGYDIAEKQVVIGLPTVINEKDALALGVSTATLYGRLTSAGLTAAEVRVYWGVEDGGTSVAAWSNAYNFGPGNAGDIFSREVAVTPGITYYYRFYATNEFGEAWAEGPAEFLTVDALVLDLSYGAGPVSYTTATLNGRLVSGGNATVALYWGENGAPWANTNLVTVTGLSDFYVPLSGLAPGTQYYYCGYGTNLLGSYITEISSFTTLAPQVGFSGGPFDGFDIVGSVYKLEYPFIDNDGGATNVSDTAAWLNGRLQSVGNSAAEVIVYWGETDGGTNAAAWQNWHSFGTNAPADFTLEIAVDQSATYYYRYFASNEAGVAWASWSSVVHTPGIPELITAEGALPVGWTTAVLHGAMVNGGTAFVTCLWGTDPYAWRGTNDLGLVGIGGFALPLTDLVPGTTYHYVLRGSNSFGVGWSTVTPFATFPAEYRFSGGHYDGFSSFDVTGTVRSGGMVLMLR